jgi:hypothetical protein
MHLIASRLVTLIEVAIMSRDIMDTIISVVMTVITRIIWIGMNIN